MFATGHEHTPRFALHAFKAILWFAAVYALIGGWQMLTPTRVVDRYTTTRVIDGETAFITNHPVRLQTSLGWPKPVVRWITREGKPIVSWDAPGLMLDITLFLVLTSLFAVAFAWIDAKRTKMKATQMG